MHQLSDLGYPTCSNPVAYAELILNGDLEIHLKTVTEYRPLDRSLQVARGKILRAAF